MHLCTSFSINNQAHISWTFHLTCVRFVYRSEHTNRCRRGAPGAATPTPSDAPFSSVRTRSPGRNEDCAVQMEAGRAIEGRGSMPALQHTRSMHYYAWNHHRCLTYSQIDVRRSNCILAHLPADVIHFLSSFDVFGENKSNLTEKHAIHWSVRLNCNKFKQS